MCFDKRSIYQVMKFFIPHTSFGVCLFFGAGAVFFLRQCFRLFYGSLGFCGLYSCSYFYRKQALNHVHYKTLIHMIYLLLSSGFTISVTEQFSPCSTLLLSDILIYLQADVKSEITWSKRARTSSYLIKRC